MIRQSKNYFYRYKGSNTLHPHPNVSCAGDVRRWARSDGCLVGRRSHIQIYTPNPFMGEDVYTDRTTYEIWIVRNRRNRQICGWVCRAMNESEVPTSARLRHQAKIRRAAGLVLAILNQTRAKP